MPRSKRALTGALLATAAVAASAVPTLEGHAHDQHRGRAPGRASKPLSTTSAGPGNLAATALGAGPAGPGADTIPPPGIRPIHVPAAAARGRGAALHLDAGRPAGGWNPRTNLPARPAAAAGELSPPTAVSPLATQPPGAGLPINRPTTIPALAPSAPVGTSDPYPPSPGIAPTPRQLPPAPLRTTTSGLPIAATPPGSDRVPAPSGARARARGRARPLTLHARFTDVLVGRPVALTVRAPRGAGGRVAIRENGKTIATAKLLNGVARVELPRRHLSAGNHTITAVYGGSRQFPRERSRPLVIRIAPHTQTVGIDSAIKRIAVPHGARFAEIEAIGASAAGAGASTNAGAAPSPSSPGVIVTGQLAVAPGQVLRIMVGASGAGSKSGATTVALAGCHDCAGLQVLLAAGSTAGGPSGSSFSSSLRCGVISPGSTGDGDGEVLVRWLRSAPRIGGRACPRVRPSSDFNAA